MLDRHRLRAAANWLTMGTPAGLALAKATGCELRRGPRQLYFAVGYQPSFPQAQAFTVGNVIVVRHPALLERDELMAHEERHTSQWAACLGIVGFPILYTAAMGWSWIRTGDRFSRNVFERRADLNAGGYIERPLRRT